MSKSRRKRSEGQTAGAITVVLADDHPIVRKGLRSLLSRSKNIRVIGEAKDGQELIELVRTTRPDAAIVDISMPGMNGVEAVKVLKTRFPEVRVLVLTVHSSQSYIAQLMLMGADGYLSKDAEASEVFAAIRTIMTGRRFFSSSVSDVIMHELARDNGARRSGESDLPLTKREIEILTLIAQGLTSREIAGRLFLSLGTVFTHRHHIMKKLNVHTKAELIHYAIKKGLLTLTQ